jgi:hypothetical protein
MRAGSISSSRRSCCTVGAATISGRASTLTSASRPQTSHLAVTARTPFLRMLAKVIGGPGLLLTGFWPEIAGPSDDKAAGSQARRQVSGAGSSARLLRGGKRKFQHFSTSCSKRPDPKPDPCAIMAGDTASTNGAPATPIELS